MRYITYARHPNGYVVSRVGNEVAFPVLEFAEIGMGGLEAHADLYERVGRLTQSKVMGTRVRRDVQVLHSSLVDMRQAALRLIETLEFHHIRPSEKLLKFRADLETSNG